MPSRKNSDDAVMNSNVNNNTNNVNVNVHVDKPKAPKKYIAKKQHKPNRIAKAIVITALTALLSFLGKYFLDVFNGGTGQAPVFEQTAPGFSRNN